MIETAARGAQFLLAIGIAYLIALWFALAAWTFRDIEARSRSVFTQVFSTLLVVLFFVPGLLLYLILRPKETLDQAFQRALEEEYLLQDLDELPLCPGCQRAVDADYVLCPHCQTNLRAPCPSCSRLIDLHWRICPYCAAAVDSSKLELPDIGVEALQMIEDGRAGRRKRAIAAAAVRAGVPIDDLDAFTDAISATGGPAAVSAGSAATRLPDDANESGSLLSGMRARFGQLGVSPFERPRDENGLQSANTAPGSQTSESKFWADPLPGAERVSQRPADTPHGKE